MNCSLKQTQLSLLAVALLAMGGISAQAATAAPLPSRIELRPVSPQNLKDYSLGSIQGSSGLSTVGVGQPAYLDFQIPLTTAASNVVSMAWSLTSKPLGSGAQLQESPLGQNVPMGDRSDVLQYSLGSRKMLKPDLEGVYRVSVTLTTTSGTTNLTRDITGARFIGWNSGCIGCHAGSLAASGVSDMSSFTNTGHATALQRKLDDSTGHFGANCISCHAVGFDTAAGAVNNGFDDVATLTGWTFPSTLTNGNWAAMPAELKNVSNVQCENCHGPGSKHVVYDGKVGNPKTISVSMDSGNCAQCHDSKTHHIKTPEWQNSGHAMAPTSPSGPGREGCVACHTARGFVAAVNGKTPTTADTVYEPLGCATCHDPHSAVNPHQLRVMGDITLMDGKTVMKDQGNAAICMKCHMSRRDAVTYVETTTGGSTFGPHDGPQSDMLAGANAITYGKQIGSSAHGRSVEETCVRCHMQEVAVGSPGFTMVGGHTFKAAVETSTNRVELVEACSQCHGEIEDFNLKRQDYDGNGVVEGVQDEVKSLLRKLAKLLPPVGQEKETIAITSSWTKQQLKAGYNYRFVTSDGSYGIHNAAYAVGLLKASIADMTGDSNNDGLPDAWQIQYFGSANAAGAAPNASPAGDGVPNWLKWTLGLVPTQKGITVPGGVVWASGSSIGGSTNTIQIFTAAEVAFNTEVGKTYQLQAIATPAGGWSNVGEPVAGTGRAYSFVTPTRQNVSQFYRVMTN